jgi:SPOR domain
VPVSDIQTLAVCSMSIAHDSDLRRTDELYRKPPRQPAGGQGAGNDRLADLARLIGQDDPFAQIGERPQASQGAADPHADAEHAPNWLVRPAQAGAPQPPGDNYYEAPPPKRRGGLTTIAAVVGLAVFGTGAVFAYRAWTGPATTGEPPVINAEQSPTKIVPAQPSDGQASKQAYDRVGDKGGERVDSREEQPVDPRAAPRPTIPGVVGPPGPINVFPPLPEPPSQAVPAAPGDAKRVTTITILTDQPGGIATPLAPPPPQSRVAPAPQAMTPTTPVTPRALPATSPARQVAARPASAEARGYVVQVSSERTQAHAQASYRALQAKYPAVLGSHRLTIKRADLGEKGIFFRTQVGPFASAEEAGKMCNSLKAAGGQCIVQRN